MEAPQADTLPLVECFHTIQGEGAFHGSAAYFIRLGGCDVGCPWCDTKASWVETDHPRASIDDIVQSAIDARCPIAVITGGEPAMHPLAALTARLAEAGIRTHLETSGVHLITGRWDWVSLSPKKLKPPRAAAYAAANELKVVVYHPSDLQWAEREAARMAPSCQLFLQPEWSRQSRVVPLILDHIKRNPRWRLSVQLHKYLAIP